MALSGFWRKDENVKNTMNRHIKRGRQSSKKQENRNLNSFVKLDVNNQNSFLAYYEKEGTSKLCDRLTN